METEKCCDAVPDSKTEQQLKLVGKSDDELRLGNSREIDLGKTEGGAGCVGRGGV